jgi:hypothetical protein
MPVAQPPIPPQQYGMPPQFATPLPLPMPVAIPLPVQMQPHAPQPHLMPAALTIAPTPQPTPAPQPFVATRSVEIDVIIKEDNPARRAEMKRLRRRKELDRLCEQFLNSSGFRWGRRVAIVSLMSFLGYTLMFMKDHRWRTPWSPKDPLEVAQEKLRAEAPRSTEAPVPHLPHLPSSPVSLPAPQLPAHFQPNHGLSGNGRELDPLDRAATLTAPDLSSPIVPQGQLLKKATF